MGFFPPVPILKFPSFGGVSNGMNGTFLGSGGVSTNGLNGTGLGSGVANDFLALFPISSNISKGLVDMVTVYTLQ